jgi:hypothetical protein
VQGGFLPSPDADSLPFLAKLVPCKAPPSLASCASAPSPAAAGRQHRDETRASRRHGCGRRAHAHTEQRRTLASPLRHLRVQAARRSRDYPGHRALSRLGGSGPGRTGGLGPDAQARRSSRLVPYPTMISGLGPTGVAGRTGGGCRPLSSDSMAIRFDLAGPESVGPQSGRRVSARRRCLTRVRPVF